MYVQRVFGNRSTIGKKVIPKCKMNGKYRIQFFIKLFSIKIEFKYSLSTLN